MLSEHANCKVLSTDPESLSSRESRFNSLQSNYNYSMFHVKRRLENVSRETFMKDRLAQELSVCQVELENLFLYAI